jgi:hypothetical protein
MSSGPFIKSLKRELLLRIVRVLCFGSRVEGDELALMVGEKLGLKCTSNVHDIQNGDVIVDVVWGLDKVRFVDLKEIKSHKSVSVHDFDLGTYLRLMKRMIRVRVIGIPPNYSLDRAVREVRGLLE